MFIHFIRSVVKTACHILRHHDPAVFFRENGLCQHLRIVLGCSEKLFIILHREKRRREQYAAHGPLMAGPKKSARISAKKFDFEFLLFGNPCI